MLMSSTCREAWAQHRLEGVVLDAETQDPLSGAHVLLEGTTIGRVTNAEGRFTLHFQQLPAHVSVRHIGYETRRLRIEDPRIEDMVIELQPAIVELDEVFVTGETFAENLMRRVIERKKTWASTTHTYEAQGFSRVVLERSGSIVHLSEATFDLYSDAIRGPRAVVTNHSRTADWYDDLPLPPAAYVPDLYRDDVEIQGLEFVGPTHPEALDRYTFRLAGRRRLNGQVVYDLYVSPRDERLATFVGMVSVLDSVFALVRAELRPARHVAFPVPLEAWRVAYIQQFAAVDDGPWLPIDLQIDGMATVTVDARRRRTFTVQQRSQLSNYLLNTTLPDGPFEHAGPVVLDEAAVLNDPHFIYGRVLMPLTARETDAIERLRNEPLTLRTAFPPADRGGRLSAFLAGGPGAARLTWPTVLGHEFRFRYNRVDGLLSSVGNTLELTPRLLLEWRLAQATGLRRVRSHFRGRREFGTSMFAEIEYRRDTQPRQRRSRFSPSASSLQPLLGGDDYFDYFWLDGANIAGGVTVGGLTLAGRLAYEKHRSVDRSIRRSWPFRERLRPNPDIPGGNLGSAAVSLNWTAPEASSAIRHIDAEIEHAPGGVAGLDFDFTRYRMEAEIRIPTLFRRRPVPVTFDFKVIAGASSGRLPPQRYFALDGSLAMLDAVHVRRFGSLISLHGRPIEGERKLGVFWKHDFTTWPFEWGILWPLAHRGMSLSLFGGHGRTWISESTLRGLSFAAVYEDRFIHEIGFSLSSVAGSILRIDVAARLDRPGFTLGIGARLNGR